MKSPECRPDNNTGPAHTTNKTFQILWKCQTDIFKFVYVKLKINVKSVTGQVLFTSCKFVPNYSYQQEICSLTVIHDVFIEVKAPAAIGQVGFGLVDWPDDALMPKITHKQLQADECKHAQTEHCQNHHI